MKIVTEIDEGLRKDWLRLRDAIVKALVVLKGAYTENELFLHVLEERIQFWVKGDAFIFSAVEQHNAKRYANLFLAGGSTDGALELRREVEEWAKAKGLDGAFMIVRHGVDKIMREKNKTDGWDSVGVMYMKDFRNG